VFTDELDAIGAMLMFSKIPQVPNTGNRGFKVISMNCHKTPETEIIQGICTA
jgi:hypothetical protein